MISHAEELIDALINTFNTSSIVYAEFSGHSAFKQEYDKYKKHRSARAFLQFSSSSMQQLKQVIDNVTLATGGYYVYCAFEENNTLFDIIFLVRNTQGKIFNWRQNTYTIANIEYLNTSDLAMACRIDAARYDMGMPHYLSFIRLKQPEVSDYFYNWVGIEQQTRTNSKEYTRKLYEVLHLVDPPVDADGKALDTIEFISRVYDYIKNAPSNNVNINDISAHFFGDETKIQRIAQQHNILIDTEFNYDKNELRKFVALHISAGDISVKITRKALKDYIRVTGDDVIISSPQLAEKVKEEVDRMRND